MLLHVYCIRREKPDFSLKGIGNNIYPIRYKGICAVVSKVSHKEFGEENLKKSLTDIKWLNVKVLEHEKVIEEVMKGSATIPFGFPIIFKTEENVRTMIKGHYEEFEKLLRRLNGKEEWGIKVYCNIDSVRDNLIKEGDIRRLEMDIKSSSSGRAYLLKKKKDEMIEAVLSKRLNEYEEDTIKNLSSLSLNMYLSKPLPKEVTMRKDEMLLNAAFLINKSRLKDFIKGISSLRKKYKGILNFCLTGPWPPYNFCRIKGKLYD